MTIRKRVFRFFLTIAMVIGLLPTTAFAAETKTYLALGDSISAGVALENPQSEGFAVLLKNNLGDDYTLVNMAAEAGETTQTLKAKLESESYKTAVAQADLITITIGGNDLMALFYEFLADGMGMTVEEVKTALGDGTDLEILTEAANVINQEENGFEITEAQVSVIMDTYKEVISSVKALNPSAALVVATQYNPYKYLTSQVNDYYSLLPLLAPDYVPLADAVLKISGVIESALNRFNPAVKAGSGYGVADVYAAFDSSSAQLCNAALVMSGMSVESVNMDFHPNAAGHKVIAECMTAAVEAELEKAPAPAAYTVSFHANGGTGEMADVTNVSGSYSLPQCSFTAPKGKVFAGWAASEDGKVITDSTIEVTEDITLYAIWADCTHTGGSATCIQQAVCENCGEGYGELAPHRWDQGVVTQEPTQEEPGIRTYTCSVCGETKTEEIPYTPSTANIQRVAGDVRYETAIQAANVLKKALDVEKFENIILACGGFGGANDNGFADALSGSYLAAVKKAPILLHYGNKSVDANVTYIQNNLASGGTVYILGGSVSVPDNVEEVLTAAGISVKRLAGNDRFLTNLEILNEAEIGGKEILVVSGWGYADSLSVSATGLPILMLNSTKNELTQEQAAFLNANKSNKITIIGGEVSISNTLKAQVEAVIGKTVDRISGNTREETSVAVAKAYFDAPEFAVVAYSRAFPDGLCGGPLANAMGAPMLLTNVNQTQIDITNAYLKEISITSGYVMGGVSVLNDNVVRSVFGVSSEAEIPGA